jgi:hypothetical protein
MFEQRFSSDSVQPDKRGEDTLEDLHRIEAI